MNSIFGFFSATSFSASFSVTMKTEICHTISRWPFSTSTLPDQRGLEAVADIALDLTPMRQKIDRKPVGD